MLLALFAVPLAAAYREFTETHAPNISRRSARMPRSEERGGMAARSEAEINSLLVYKSPARQGGVLYSNVESPVVFHNFLIF